MDIYEAWNAFEKTGSIIKYLEYKTLCEKKENENIVVINKRSCNKIN